MVSLPTTVVVATATAQPGWSKHRYRPVPCKLIFIYIHSVPRWRWRGKSEPIFELLVFFRLITNALFEVGRSVDDADDGTSNNTNGNRYDKNNESHKWAYVCTHKHDFNRRGSCSLRFGRAFGPHVNNNSNVNECGINNAIICNSVEGLY